MTNALDDSKVMKSKLRPFVSSWKQLSPDLISTAKEILFLTRKYGIEKVGEAEALKNRVEFFAAVHDGWKLVQQKIANEIIVRLDEVASLKAQSKDFHRQKKSEEKFRVLRKAEVKEAEIKVLRRFIDTIVWILFDNEHSSIRRLALPDGNDNLSKQNIIDSMAAADLINKEPTSIAIVSDLTTFVHAGDLVVMKMGQGVALTEVKTGDKNIEFSHAAQFSVKSKCEHFDKEFTQDFNEKDIKHYNRTKKQWQRLTDITGTINNGSGYDYYHKQQVKIEDENYIPEFYNQDIVDRWTDIKAGKNWSIAVIDECVYVGAYKTTEMGFVGFNSWMDGTDFKGHVFNISDSIGQYFVQPLFNLNLPHELIEDIIDSEVIIVLCLDFRKFMELGNEKYPNLLHLAPLPKLFSDPGDYFMIGKQAIFSYKNGNKSFIGTGLESRIIFDLQRPANIIDWIYKGSDLYATASQSKQASNAESARRLAKRTKKNKNKNAKRSRRLNRK
ncbi:hypothetical protein VSP75_15610 [Escherichia coli]|uniref:hypothetical protein n=1 Tax=Escherichia coli TaxID=562 RepID=UPI002DB60F00|nr:hypothetical protein [Escherichia coli]MEC4192597.1 hypothetical protein [Escherichia coli]MEC4245447.1 hypothetical protein [Escherichia coli]